MDFPSADKKFMRMAIRLAEKGRGYTTPNPPVGAVIVKDDQVVGKGWHKKAGTPHAEVNAIADADNMTNGADIYVTLEPCNHTGRTPPCTEAILKAGIKRIVIGAMDPNPKVKGGGADFLRHKGLRVDTGCLEDQCKLLIAPFAKHMRSGLPWVRAKAASSLDGRVATKTGHSKWITNKRARNYGQELRRWSDAIVIGKNTALLDNPRLTFRKRGWPEKTLLRIILDSTLSLPFDLEIFKVSRKSPTLVATTRKAPSDKRERLMDMGVEIMELPSDRAGGVDIGSLLEALGKRTIQSILVEGGAQVHGTFWDKGLVDEAFFFFAPIVIGGNKAPCSVLGKGIEKVTEAPRLKHVKIRRFNDNLMVHGLVTELARYWS